MNGTGTADAPAVAGGTVARGAIPQQRSGTSTGTAGGVGHCRCGHGVEAHVHYRSGRDCGVCGGHVCRRYRVAAPTE